jgi:hypothetical protein
MLHMKKNTKAKAAAILASAIALASIFGLVRQGALVTPATTQPAQAAGANVVSKSVATKNAPAASAQVKAATKVNTRTHVS